MIGFLIQSALEHFATVTPQHPALCFQGEELCYEELDRRSNQLAHALIKNGAKQQDRIAIYMHKSIDLGVAIYGALKAGCVFVPIDPLIPLERLTIILDDCGIRHAVCSSPLIQPLIDACGGSPINVYGVDENSAIECGTSWASIAEFPATRPDLSIIDQDLGYIMYTSGSTGVPKGMTHTHHGSISYARWGANHVAMKPADRVASHAPLHFDLSIFDFFSTAQSGATVILVPEAVTRFPASWTKTIELERISIVFTVPYTLISMLEHGAMEQRNLTSLRWILYGGEPFPPAKLRKLMLALSNVKVTNVYGPAEAPSCSCYTVTVPEEGNDEPIPIGRVSKNSSFIIIDEQDNDCDRGEAGELCIRSSTLTRGYWNRPDLNESAYLLRPSLVHFPNIYYRTGDRVYCDTNGILHFLGRQDRMIKVRGQRVELDEVESILASHHSVFEAAAFSISDETLSQQVLAAITLKSGEKIDEGELLRYARARLSAYALPRKIFFQPKLPHNSNGKIDHKLLKQQWQPSTK